MLFKKCSKCKTMTFVEIHHILPQAIFGKNDETDFLCPNCHREYHRTLGTENLKNPDPKFHFYFYWRWLYGTLVVILSIGGLFYFWRFIKILIG